MHRLTVFLKRAPGLSRAEFVTRWRALFAAVAARGAPDGRPAQILMNLPLAPIPEKLGQLFGDRFDGVGELWFETLAQAVAGLTRLNGDAGLRAQARGCIDINASSQWLAEVVPQREVPGTGIKFVVAGQTADGMSVAEAQLYWREVHPKVFLTVEDFKPYITRYVQMHGRDVEALQATDWLALYHFVPMCADMGLRTIADIEIAYTMPSYLAIIRPDEQVFSKPGEMLSFASQEFVEVR